MFRRNASVASIVARHFRPTAPNDLLISQRSFPARVRADLQRAMDGNAVFDGAVVERFVGLPDPGMFESHSFGAILNPADGQRLSPTPAQYDEVDVGEGSPVRCLRSGLWLLRRGRVPMAVIMSPQVNPCQPPEIVFHVAMPRAGQSNDGVSGLFDLLEKAVAAAPSYRGKVLSLEQTPHYSGQSAAIKVHHLRQVDRDQIVLPEETVSLLERNVVHFVRQRPRLAQLGLPTKKGVLFYGPPGTGKTHTIHYLAAAMEGHTTLLVSGEQVALVDEYIALARLLQPSILVIEDADLIARCRDEMRTACEEVMLNKLLNEMDGLREDAQIVFILTTNRPEALEQALTSRPGRIDQAIEFPLPNANGRRKLAKLYARGVQLADDVLDHIVRKTDRVSGAFIKELMRRAVQFHLERSDSALLTVEDVDSALDELLTAGGSLNRKLLGTELDDPPA